MLDEILEIFSRRNRRLEAGRHHPEHDRFGELVDGDDEDGDGARRFPRDENRRDGSRRERSNRRPFDEDWD